MANDIYNNDNIKKLGRSGDTEIRDVKGEPSHVNPYEAYLIDTYKVAGEEAVESMGSGTINPETGMKEYFLGFALAAGSMLYGAYKGGQQANAYDEAVGAAGQIKQERLDLVGQKRDLGYETAESQFTGASRDVGFGVQAGQRNISSITSQTGLATSGTMQTKTDDLMAKYKSDMTKLFETRDLSRTQSDLSYRQGEISAEEAYQNTIAGLDPGGALEGGIEAGLSAFGSIV